MAYGSYDADGNLLSDALGNKYTWNAEDKLIAANGEAIVYDAFNTVVEDNGVEIITPPGLGRVEQMSGQSFTSASVPAPGGGRIVYTGGSTIYAGWSLLDWHGDARFTLKRQTRDTLQQGEFSPFGQLYDSTADGGLSWLFDGSFMGTVVNAYDMDHRMLNSIQGRWIQPDPAGLAAVDPTNPQTWNRYAYVLNNPLSAVDPTGLDCVYLNDAGNGVDSIDHNSNAQECSGPDANGNPNGGYWIPATVDNSSWVTNIDQNNNQIGAFSQFDNGTLGWTGSTNQLGGGWGTVGVDVPTTPVTGNVSTPTSPDELTPAQRTIFTLAYQRSVHDLGCVGLGGLIAGGSAAASAPIIPKPFSAGGTSGTSLASTLLGGVNTGTSLPTPVGMPGTSSFAWRATADLGRFAGRWLPYAGMAYGAYKLNQCLSSLRAANERLPIFRSGFCDLHRSCEAYLRPADAEASWGIP
jgi:RHS repeat-associated protein